MVEEKIKTKEKEVFFKWFKKGVESMFGHFNAPKFYDMDEFWEDYRERFEEVYKNEE